MDTDRRSGVKLFYSDRTDRFWIKCCACGSFSMWKNQNLCRCSQLPTMVVYKWPQRPHYSLFCVSHYVAALFFQTMNGLNEESPTEHLEFPLLTQRSLSSITQLLPFLRTLCCSFQSNPSYNHLMSHLPVADYPPASSEKVLKNLEKITEEEFLDSLQFQER